MLRAYFDRNVFQNLRDRRGGVGPPEERRIQSAVRRKQLHIAIGFPVIAETLELWHSDQFRARNELKYILVCIAGMDLRRVRFVKDVPQLLKETFQAAASGQPQPAPFVTHDLRWIVEPTIQEARQIQKLLQEQRRMKEHFRESGERAKQDVLRGLGAGPRGITFGPGQRRPFAEFFQDLAPDWVRALAAPAGLSSAEVDSLGYDRLLRLPTVRAAVGASLGLVFGQVVENRAVQESDWMDLGHAISAAASAEVLVTEDQRLRDLINQIPDCSLQAITLHELLGQLQRLPS